MCVCIVEGCGKSVYGNGKRGGNDAITKYCRTHYRRFLARGTPDPAFNGHGSLKERFERALSLIDKTDGCWIWPKAKNTKGYGHIGADINNGGKKTELAHRVSYEYHKEAIPDGYNVLHSCDNPSCINPDHLRVGSQSENIKEAFDKGRKFNPVNYGENHPKSKITREQAKFIKANPQLGHKQIADMFGVSPNCIRGVRIGRTWKEA